MPDRLKKKFLIALSLTFVFFTGPVVAGVYKWVDENGEVHFGDRPPNKDAKEVRIKAPPPATSTSGAHQRLERQQKLLQSYDEERQLKAEDKAKADKLTAKRKRNCQIARERAERFKISSYLYEKDEAGNKTILSHERRSEAEKKAQADVGYWCK